jgi:type I restriction enzyme, S subunit
LIIGAREVSCKEAPSRARQLVAKNDILVSTVRPNLNGVAQVPTDLDGATASTGFCVLRPRSTLLDGRFLFQWVKSPVFIADMVNKATGASYPAVSDRIILESIIPLPSLPEQQRIAEILDRAGTLRAKRLASLAQLDELVQSIFIEMFGDPARNTKNIPVIYLSELGEWQSGGTPPRGREDYFEGSIPWFSSGELEEMFISKSKEHISEKTLSETSAKAVPKGALMLGMYDTAALKASIACVDCSCNQAIAFATLNQEIAETVFVYFAIVIGREHFRRLQRGVRQKNLNLSMVREISIPLPPLSLQKEFSLRVEAVNKLKTAHKASLEELDELFTSLQYRAFKGEL